MQIVHLGQSCMLVEIGTARLLLDPGIYSTGFEELTGLDAVLVTHQHPDHLDLDRLPALLAANPASQLIVDVGTAGPLADAGIAYRLIGPGDQLELAGATVDVLLLPTAAPWLKVSEAVDYLRAVDPGLAVPIHQAILAKPEKHYELFRELAPVGTEVHVVAHAEPFTL